MINFRANTRVQASLTHIALHGQPATRGARGDLLGRDRKSDIRFGKFRADAVIANRNCHICATDEQLVRDNRAAVGQQDGLTVASLHEQVALCSDRVGHANCHVPAQPGFVIHQVHAVAATCGGDVDVKIVAPTVIGHDQIVRGQGDARHALQRDVTFGDKAILGGHGAIRGLDGLKNQCAFAVCERHTHTTRRQSTRRAVDPDFCVDGGDTRNCLAG